LIALLSLFFLLLSVLYTAVIVFLIVGWHRVKRPQVKTSGFTTKVTILVAARNEEEKIHLTIEDLLAQDYPKELTEIIIADDHSTDRTSAIIQSYAAGGVKLLQLNEDKPLNSYKKKAIGLAIDMSTGDLMVATDADCRMGSKWLSTIVGYFEMHQPYVISSPVTYFEEKSLFERMQTLEFYTLVATGAAFIGNNHASTCNGANLAYRKDIFYEVGGFKGIDDLASGDDELLLQKVEARFPGKIGFLKRFEVIVYTHAKANLKEFLQQRRRWASKSVKYKDKKVVAVVVGLWLFNVSVGINLLLGFWNKVFFEIFGGQLLLLALLELILLLPVTMFFKRRSLLILIPISIPLYVAYFIFIGLIGNKGKYLWKGRMVR